MLVKPPRLVLAAAPWAMFMAATVCAAFSFAADDSRKFVDALRERKYFDTAAEYLDALAAKPGLPADVARIVGYQQALVLIDSAAYERTPGQRDDKLADAQAKLKTFLAANPEHELAAAARDRLASLLRYRAGELVSQADKAQGDPVALRKEARGLYADARTIFQDSAKRLRAQLDATPKVDAQRETREQIGGQWLGASLNVGRTTFELALASDPQSPERKQLLEDAAKQCSKLYGDYPKRLGGMTGRLYEGRCYEELGNSADALEAYNNVVVESEGEGAFRLVKTQALLRAIPLWLAKKDNSTAVDKSVFWVKSAHADEQRDPDWVALRLLAAKSLFALADTLPTGDSKTDGYLTDARALASDVVKSRIPEQQSAARALLEKYAGTPPAGSKKSPLSGKGNVQLTAETVSSSAAPFTAELAELKTFDAAFEKFDSIFDEMQGTEFELSDRSIDAKHRAELNVTLDKQRAEAFAICQRAISLSDAKTDAEKLNRVKYVLCFLYYKQGNYDASAVVGEHVARRYPKATNARDCARAALAALDAAYRNSKQTGQDGAFETARLLSFIDYVIKTWPDQPEAGAASELLVNLYTTAGDYDKAAAALARLPENSAARTDAELKFGQALWAKYLRTAQQLRDQKSATGDGTSGNAGSEDAKAKEELDAALKQAQQSLERGVAGLRKQDDVSDRGVLAIVSLAQVYLTASQPDKAVALLEDPKIGPLTLVRKKHPATQTEGLTAEIFKTALRAYIDSEPQQLDKATAAMDSLEKIYTQDSQGSAKLTQMLVSIAYDLKQQLDELGRQGQTQRQERLIKAFDRFLSRIPDRSDSADFKTLNWVGVTYDSLAGGLSGGGKLVPDADSYYRQAIKAYEQILARAAADPNYIPEDRLPGIKRNLAVDYRAVGEYDKSTKVLAAILKEKPTLLPLQVEAARTFQARGAAQDPVYYVRAIEGGDKDSPNIWGWGKLAVQTSKDPKFRDIFHEARYNLTVCRKKFAEASDKPEVKKVAFEKAKNDIRNTKQFDSTLGGDKWRPLYDSLLKEIQKGLSEDQVGLDGLK